MKITLITGASGGIGEAIANRLAKRKHNILLVARNEAKLKTLAGQLAKEHQVSVEYISTDLSKAGAAQNLFEETQARKLEVEMLINNAGVGSGGEFAALSVQSELDMLQLNISSLVSLTHLFLQPMKARNSGTIINVASVASFMPIPYMTTYSASKVFVRHFTQALTQECKPYNVHVMLLCPGLTKTNFNSAAGLENEIGKGLGTEYSGSTQTPGQVADEMLKALDKRKHYIVSGRINRMATRLSALFPNAVLAKSFANSYRKKLGN
ncbi:SDR family NAD(P)-dependent oxidoreductase [Arthrospiribacter ruber]|uniref:SDR family oxidoreductase n=1 Tax=Arthrospiribacter ruber TaxID=2487934 RepID=A0A951MDD2_9BACT|nr:SDR family oxidoreductase [Arthrospiribacter ruber]MBW3470456.1 SDR family oxidoreductase [Arthrospiribacter ruber]